MLIVFISLQVSLAAAIPFIICDVIRRSDVFIDVVITLVSILSFTRYDWDSFDRTDGKCENGVHYLSPIRR